MPIITEEIVCHGDLLERFDNDATLIFCSTIKGRDELRKRLPDAIEVWDSGDFESLKLVDSKTAVVVNASYSTGWNLARRWIFFYKCHCGNEVLQQLKHRVTQRGYCLDRVSFVYVCE